MRGVEGDGNAPLKRSSLPKATLWRYKKAGILDTSSQEIRCGNCHDNSISGTTIHSSPSPDQLDMNPAMGSDDEACNISHSKGESVDYSAPVEEFFLQDFNFEEEAQGDEPLRNDDEIHRPLYDGACISLGQAIVLIMSYTLMNGVSMSGLDCLLQLMQALLPVVEWTNGRQLSIVGGQHLKNAKMLFSKEEGDIEWANLDACPPPDGWEVHRGQVLNFSTNRQELEKTLGEIALTRSKETKREKQKRTKEKRDQTMKKMAGKLIQEDEEQGKQTKETLLTMDIMAKVQNLEDNLNQVQGKLDGVIQSQNQIFAMLRDLNRQNSGLGDQTHSFHQLVETMKSIEDRLSSLSGSYKSGSSSSSASVSSLNMLPLDNVYAAVDSEYTPILRGEVPPFSSEAEASNFPPPEQTTYGVRATSRQSPLRRRGEPNTTSVDDEIQSILTSVKKFRDWKKVCEILTEKLFGNEVLARSNVSGIQGCMKLNDEKLEVLKGYLTETFKVSDSTVQEKIRQRCAYLRRKVKDM
ncbi:unnamed protein product [Darwinula stevensoni]|uniref:BEN domain-containing protein n=1 Tax=Darwinula stevensoni TaxID=69355 RepID=A0A7R9A7S4_9CRUS|nr:unnamed protein product [Darwinula stevensoni]CAG0893235.1 unnamed protein product [Darwinula stevensoni]